jgi:hypothetical protein
MGSYLTVDVGKSRRALGQLITRRGGSIERHLIAKAGWVTREAKVLARENLHVDRPTHRRRWPDKPHYVDSFKSSAVVHDPRGLRIKIVNTHPAARAIERGTKPHTIQGKNLYFPAGKPWRVDGDPFTGKPVFKQNLKRVNHPGTKGYGIMRGALRRRGRIR